MIDFGPQRSQDRPRAEPIDSDPQRSQDRARAEPIDSGPQRSKDREHPMARVSLAEDATGLQLVPVDRLVTALAEL
jgi:hypothetical protein